MTAYLSSRQKCRDHESKLMGWHSCRTEDASRASISAPHPQRKMLKATPTCESAQNPGMVHPHSTLGQTELKGRGGWGHWNQSLPCCPRGCKWDPDVQACSPCGWLAKETHSSPSCWVCTAKNSQRAVGEVPHHLGRPLPGEAARLQEEQGRRAP